MDFKRSLAVIITLTLLLGTVKVFATYEGISNIITTVSLNFDVNIPEPYRVESNESNEVFKGEKYNWAKLNYDYEGIKRLETEIKWEQKEITYDEIKGMLEESLISYTTIESIQKNMPTKEKIDKHFIIYDDKKVLIMLYSEFADMLYVYEVH